MKYITPQLSCCLAFKQACHRRSVTKPRLILCGPVECSMQGFPVPHHLPECTQVHVCWNGDAIQPSHPLSSTSPLAFHLCQHQGLFQWVSSSQQVAKVLEFQLQHQSFQWIFRSDFLQDWLDLIAVWGTLKSLLQHHSSKSSILQCSVLFIVQLSHPYMTTGKNITLTRWTFVGKIMPLLFNMLSVRMHAKSLQSCPTHCDPLDCSPPGSSVNGTFQEKVLEWVTMPFSREYAV